MNNAIGAPAPAWLRIVAALGLLWNLVGVYNYLVTVGVLGPGGGSEPTMADAMPGWVTGAFAIAVFAGVIGCADLLLLKRRSIWFLLLSLVAVLAMDVWSFMMRDRAGGMAGAELGLTAAVTLIAILLVWLSYFAGGKGWLR